MCDNLSDDREYDENCANIQLEKNRDDYKELKTVGCVVRPNKIVKSLKDELYEKFCELRRNKNHFVKYDLHPYLPKDHPRFLEFCTSNTSKTKYKGYSLVQRDEQKKIWKYMCSICLVDLNYSLWTNNENKKLRDEYRNLFRKLKCGHEFHVKCITNYSYCPNCRQVEEKLSNNPTSPENIILNKKKEILHGYTKTIAQVRKEYENILMCEEGALEICSTPSPPRPPTPPPSKKRPRPPQTEEEKTPSIPERRKKSKPQKPKRTPKKKQDDGGMFAQIERSKAEDKRFKELSHKPNRSEEEQEEYEKLKSKLKTKYNQNGRNEYGENHSLDHKENKEEMNKKFGGLLEENKRIDSPILVLDDDTVPKGGLGTSNYLCDHFGVDPKNLHIPQCNLEKSETMKLDVKFGKCVHHNTVVDYLKKNPSQRFGGIYLDLCGTYTGQLKPALEEFFRGDRIPPEGIVLAMTWTHRDAESKLHHTTVELSNFVYKKARRINMEPKFYDPVVEDNASMHVLFVSLVPPT